jgi:hypothetical protein
LRPLLVVLFVSRLQSPAILGSGHERNSLAEGFMMERSSKRGKIPQRDWPSIMARHEAGETLASIARTYDCSPPAISYIVSRSRARNTVAQEATSGPVSIGEPQLIKTHATEIPATAVSERQPVPSETSAPPAAAPDHPSPRFVAEQGLRLGEPRLDTRPRENNGNGSHGRYFAAQPDAAAERERGPAADARRTLHLSLGNGGDHAPPPQPGADRQQQRQPPAPPPTQPRPASPYPAANSAAPARMLPEQPKPREGAGGAIDQALRERVQADIATFLAAFDQALASDTAETRASLREATDRLLRAGARTRIELERLEARVPLPRERRETEPMEWRHR